VTPTIRTPTSRRNRRAIPDDPARSIGSPDPALVGPIPVGAPHRAGAAGNTVAFERPDRTTIRSDANRPVLPAGT